MTILTATRATPPAPRWRRVLPSIALVLAACRPVPQTPLARLADRVPTPAVSAERIAGEAEIGQRPVTVTLPRPLEAGDIGGLGIRLSGKAHGVSVNWRRAGEPGFSPGRRVIVLLERDGGPHDYLVELTHEDQWIGTITDLRLTALGGSAHLESITLQGAPAAARDFSLRGVALPSIARQGTFDIPLTADLPRRARLETRLGLLPELQRAGATGCFSIALYAGGAERSLLDRCLGGPLPSGDVSGWTPVALDVELPEHGRLRFASRVEVGGKAAASGALWGDPLLVAPRPADGRNLVLVVVDTLRADVLGAYGNRDGLTPNLDALAKRSVRLAALHAPASWTLPSVGSLMTGLQPQTHGGGRQVGGTEAPSGIAGGVVTLAETLAAQGVYTSAIYKNIYLNPEFGLDQGFDVYASHETMPGSSGEVEANAGFLVDGAIAELERLKDRRFFLYLHLFDPHNPYEAPPSWCASVARRLRPNEHSALGCRVDRRPEDPMPAAADFPWIRALYEAEVAYTDHELGRFFAALDGLGLDDNTVVVFVSDHGEEFYERAESERQLGYEPSSDHGHTLYEELLHVPAMIAAPGLAPRVVSAPVQMVDLFPTLLALLGVSAPPNEGQDLGAALRGAPPPVETLVADTILHGPARQAVRRGPWKLVRRLQGGPLLELYDLDADPGELRNLAAARPDIAQSLRRLLLAELDRRAKLRLSLLAANSLRPTFLDWAHITKLRSLGYLK